jgi:hypothetical protein
MGGLGGQRCTVACGMRGADAAANPLREGDGSPEQSCGARSSRGENSTGHGSGGEHETLKARSASAPSARASASQRARAHTDGGPVWEPDVAKVIELSGWPEDVFMDPAKQVREFTLSLK